MIRQRGVRHGPMGPVSFLTRIVSLILRSPNRPASGYDAFISYSHLEDDALAATLQVGLETFASPWYQSRTLRVFRDTTNLTATPGLLSEIVGALSVSRWFVLVASERAARSRWVSEEVSWWLANRDPKRFLIALSGGEIRWDGQDFDWKRTTALPAVLAGVFAQEPGWIDLREVKDVLARGSNSVSAGSPRRLTRYRARRQIGDWVAGLAAPIRGVAKDNLVGEHLRYRKRTRRMVQAVLATMLTLTVAASAAAAIAADQLAAARQQTRVATARELAALAENLLTKHLDLAELFAAEAYRLNPSPSARAALFQAVTAAPRLASYLPAGGEVSAVAGSGGGRVIVAGRSDGAVLRWSLPNTQPTVIAHMTGPVTGVSVDDSGTAVVAISHATVLRWDAGRGARPLPVPRGQKPAGAAISPSGHFTAVASVVSQEEINNQFELMLYGQRAVKVNTTMISNPTLSPEYLAFASDSQLVTLNYAYGAWHRLSVPDLAPLGGSTNTFGNEYVAALSPGGDFISSSNGSATLSVWSIKNGSITPTPDPLNIATRGAVPNALAINLTGTLIAQASAGYIYVSRITRDGTSAAPLTLTGNSVINRGALAFAGRNELISASGDLLSLWDLRQYSRIAREISIPAPFACAACSGPTVAVQSTGARVAVLAGDNDTVTEQDLSSDGKPIVTRSHFDSYGLPLWTQDGKRLIVPTADGGAQIWSTAKSFTKSGRWPSSSLAQMAAGDQPILPEAIVLRPDGRQIVEVLPSGAILVRNAVTGKVDELIKWPHNVARAAPPQGPAAVDSAGQVAAVIASDGVVITSITTRRSRTLSDSSADAVAFDGEQLLVQQSDGSLQVWNADATHLVRVIAGMAGIVAGPVVGGGGLVAETSSDGSAAVIDLNSGVTLGTFQPPAGTWVYSTGIGLSAAGTSLVTVTEAGWRGGPGELTEWQMSVASWLKVACASAGHALTSAEWQEYVGGSPPGQLACAGSASA